MSPWRYWPLTFNEWPPKQFNHRTPSENTNDVSLPIISEIGPHLLFNIPLDHQGKEKNARTVYERLKSEQESTLVNLATGSFDIQVNCKEAFKYKPNHTLLKGSQTPQLSKHAAEFWADPRLAVLGCLTVPRVCQPKFMVSLIGVWPYNWSLECVFAKCWLQY